ncbi:hypothetical protein JTB14_029434 [Gonioctena quinquepunctata]|nr:hypothetical protein JTB14_029434 [Gonioctena quinquepunctata]
MERRLSITPDNFLEVVTGSEGSSETICKMKKDWPRVGICGTCKGIGKRIYGNAGISEAYPSTRGEVCGVDVLVSMPYYPPGRGESHSIDDPTKTRDMAFGG